LFVEFLSKIDEGRTVVLLENTFSTVNEWRGRGTDDDFLGDLTEESLGIIIGIWSARNGPLKDWLFVREEIKCISSWTFAVGILRETAQRWIFRWRVLLVVIDRMFSIDTARLVLVGFLSMDDAFESFSVRFVNYK
jgi:hypothetical protein